MIIKFKKELPMSTIKSDVGDLFYEALMEALAEEAAPPKKESNKQIL